MTPDEIDRLLSESKAEGMRHAEDRAAARAEAAIRRDLRPVHPLPPAWALTLVLFTLFAVFGAASAAILGLHGLAALSNLQRSLIFPALAVSAWLAAVACEREMSPAGGTRISFLALGFATLLFVVLFAVIFEGYSLRNLVAEGIPCLVAGLVVAIPTGLAIGLVLRRGFVLDWSAAGVAAGSMAGLAGLGMLELHCANLKAIHVILWHVTVVITSGALGFAAGRIAAHRLSKRQM